jgi:hypothetical protein
VAGDARREVFSLVAVVVAVDVIFVALFFLAKLRTASESVKLGFTAIWTLATLGAVLRGLTRVRRARLTSSASRL